MNNVELLAPAGDAAALHAAVSAGADAVYLGLESFNARRGADNFTIESLAQACAYAHLRGVSVYVALNTVVMPREVDDALECARQAYRAGADAFIVQDLGLASELVRTLPEARLHVSTQMNIHNEAGIRAAARLGARRVTLARELSLGEIAHLAEVASKLGVEVETFAHGALCVCYSGQCFMSSMIGGRSANRGMCAQACRLPYELHNASVQKPLPSSGEHLLSPRDLASVDLIPELIAAGVASFKIEGRMKSPEYVSSVVGVYRQVLDRALEARTEQDGAQPDGRSVRVTDDERIALSEAFSRGFTTAYLEGERGNDIMSYQRPNNRGAFIGRVSEVRGDIAYVSAERELFDGDVIEFWTKRGHSALTLKGVYTDKQGRACVALTPKERSVRAGDRVFRVRSAASSFDDDALEPRIPVVGSIRVRKGLALAATFRIADASMADKAGFGVSVARRLSRSGASTLSGFAEGPVVEVARTKAISADDVRAHVDRLGSTPFALVSLEVDLDEGVGVGFSQIHHVRAAALDALAEELLAGKRDRVLPRVSERESHGASHACACHVAAWVTNPVCARAARKAGADIIYVPALNRVCGESVIAGQLTGASDQASYPKQCVFVIQAVDHDAVGKSREALVGVDVWSHIREGSPVLVESLGGMQRAAEVGAEFEVGPHVPVANALSLEVMRGFGARRVWLTPELTLRQIEDLGQAKTVELGLAVIGRQELMVTEHCMLMSQGPCSQACGTCARRKSPHYLKDRKGFEFPVVTDALGRSHLYNSVQLDVVPSIPALLAAGVTAFMVDATLMNGEETAQAVARVARAVRVAQADGNTLAKMPETTSGHLYRGVM